VRWLKEAHSLSPIAFALRPEDRDAVRIELDAWHRWSASQIPEQVLPRLAPHAKEKPRTTTGSYLLAYALEFVPTSDRRRVPGELIRWAKRA